jgi:cytochrome c oxidase assembly factor CtaG
VAYVARTGPLNRRRPDAASRVTTSRQRAWFIAGLATILVALGPPLDDWADHFSLLAHMVQHLLLMLLAAPLLMLGTPSWLLRSLLLRRRSVAWAAQQLTRPVVAFGLSSAILVIWHVPALYDAALANTMVHAVEHLSLLAGAVLMWWPLVAPLPEWPRLSPPLQCLYLFALTIPSGIVGSFITLSEPGLYKFYVTAPRALGLGLEADQELAGILMWLGGSTIFLLLMTVIFFRWAGREEAAERAAMPATGR